MASQVAIEYHDKLAVITLVNESKLNALDNDGYYELARLLRDVALNDKIYITMLTGQGRFFSAGADLESIKAKPPNGDHTRYWLQNFVTNNLNITHAFYTHPKILITALNGPAIGLSAALIAFSDFIYCVPDAYILTPFSSLGLVAEGGSSRAFVQRLGIAKANEALIMSKRISAEELLDVGFVNKIMPCSQGEGANFKTLVLEEIHDRFGDHLISDSLLKIKALIRKPERDTLDSQGVAEVFGGLERFVAGIPQEEFAKFATGKKRHKL